MKELLTGSTTRRHCGRSPSWPPWGSASELLRWPSTCGSCSPCLCSTGIGGLALKLCLLIGQYYNYTHHVIEDNVLEVLLTVSIYTGHPLQSPDWILQILNPVLIMNNTEVSTSIHLLPDIFPPWQICSVVTLSNWSLIDIGAASIPWFLHLSWQSPGDSEEEVQMKTPAGCW